MKNKIALLLVAIVLAVSGSSLAQTNTPTDTPTSTPTNTPTPTKTPTPTNTPTKTPTAINETQNFALFRVGGDLNYTLSRLTAGTYIFPLSGDVMVFGSTDVKYIIPPWRSFAGTLTLRSVDGFSTVTGGNISVATYVQPGQTLNANFDGTTWYLSYFAGTPVPSHTPTPTP